jgi:2-amino-4-hydroxy-6-hydroxymethyldihydropteridine diphosphokinase
MGETCKPSVAFVAVGSNIEPEKNIASALTALAKRVCVVASSTFYRTVPVGPEDQPPFVNGVWRVATTLDPVEIKNGILGRIEVMLGRRRTEDRFAARTIDLDLVLYNDLVVQEAELDLPHPDLVRPFVHAPVRELLDRDGADIDVELRRRIAELLPAGTSHALPGKPLVGFTERLTRLLAASAQQHTS